MFKVVLVMAFLKEHKWKSQFNLRDNLGIGYLSAMLRREGYEVDVINAEMLYEEEEEVAKRIMAGNYDLAGFSCSAQRTYNPTVNILKLIRQAGYQNHVSIGGVFATVATDEIMQDCSYFDSVILGDGEFTMLELVKALENGLELRGIKSLVYRNHKGQIVKNPRRARLNDLDALPFPEHDEYDFYKQEIQSGELFLRVIAGRGCNGTCTFCSTGNLQAGENRRIVRSPENVLEELKYNVKKYACRHFRFSDDLFFDKSKKSQAWLMHFLNLIRESNLEIKFDVCMRAREITYEIVKEMEALGLNRVFIGVESGSDNVLKRLNKSCTVKDNENAISIMRRFPNIQVDLGFIMFEPEMTLDDLNDSFQWLRAHKEVASKHNLYNKLNIYYKTKLYHVLKAKNLLEPARFWERHSYKFEDSRVQRVLTVLEDLKVKMMEYNQKEVELKKCQREIILKHGATHKELEELKLEIKRLKDSELIYWLDVFEECIAESQKGNQISVENYKEGRTKLIKKIDVLMNGLMKAYSNSVSQVPENRKTR